MTEIDEMPTKRYGTRMTLIGRICTDPCVSASSAQSVFYRIPPIIDDGKKLQINADERRYVHSLGFGEIIHRKGRKERKAAQKEPLRFGVKKTRYGINNELERTDTNSGHSEFVRVRISSLLISVLRLLCTLWRMGARRRSLPFICGRAVRGDEHGGREDERDWGDATAAIWNTDDTDRTDFHGHSLSVCIRVIRAIRVPSYSTNNLRR